MIENICKNWETLVNIELLKRPPIFKIALKNYLKSIPSDLGLGTENSKSWGQVFKLL